MNGLHQWVALIIQVVTTVVLIVWFFAKLDKRIDLIKQEMRLKFDELGNEIREKKKDLSRIEEGLKEVSDKLTEHLINHK